MSDAGRDGAAGGGCGEGRRGGGVGLIEDNANVLKQAGPIQLKTVLDLIAGDSARRAHPIPELMHPIKLNMVGILPWVAAFEAATGLADGAP